MTKLDEIRALGQRRFDRIGRKGSKPGRPARVALAPPVTAEKPPAPLAAKPRRDGVLVQLWLTLEDAATLDRLRGPLNRSAYLRLRALSSLQDKEFKKLLGIVEVDETFVGGKAHNKHKNKRDGGGRGGLGSGKVPVVGAVSRKGNVVARVIDTVSAEVLTKFVREAVSEDVSLLVTDEWTGYRHVKKLYPHQVIKHTAGEYVVGAVHTNTIEGFWSIFKRGVVGTFHKVSKKYLPLYVAEFEFRYNNRENADIFGTAIAGC